MKEPRRRPKLNIEKDDTPGSATAPVPKKPKGPVLVGAGVKDIPKPEADEDWEEGFDASMERCVNCGQETPHEFIEHLDDMYYGQCEWCVAGT